MAKQKKSYRLTFTIDNQRAQFTAHTQAEAASIRLHVRRLISSKRTGAPAMESAEWAQTRPNGALKNFLIRWGLLDDNSDNERTLKDLFEHFQKRGVKAATLLTYKDAFQNLTDFFGADKPLQTIAPKDASDFEHYLRTAAYNGAGYSKATVKKRIQRVKQFFIEARRLKWISENPFDGIQGGNLANPKKWLYIPREAVLEVMENIADLEARARIALCRFAGARGKSEFDSLEWNQSWIIWSADGKQGTVRLHRQKTEDSGYSDTIVPMVPELEAVLRDLFDSAAPGTVKVFKPVNNPGKVIKDQFRRNGIDILEPYNLRRSYCRDLMEKGLDPKSYEYYAGHSLKVAMQFYQSWDDLRAQTAAPKVLEALTGSGLREKAGTQFGTHQVHNLVHSINSQCITSPNKKDGLSLENGAYCMERKSPCMEMQGLIIGATGIEQSAKAPQKQGLFNNADNASTQFGTHLNYFEQILTLFDRLEPDQQAVLLETLQGRIQSAAGISR